MVPVLSISLVPTPASSWVVSARRHHVHGSGVQDNPAWNGDSGQVNRYRDYFMHPFAYRAPPSIPALRPNTASSVPSAQGDFTFDTLAPRVTNNLGTTSAPTPNC